MSDHELRDKIAKKLYVERLMHEMSQSELAEKIGTRKSNVSRMEKGRQNISVDYLEVLANAFDKDIELVLSDHQVSYGDTTEYSLRALSSLSKADLARSKASSISSIRLICLSILSPS